MTTLQLQSELNNDPLGLGYAALISAGSDAGILSILTALDYMIQGPVSVADVLIWAVSNNLLIKFQDIAAADGLLQNAAAGILLAIRGGLPNLDVTLPNIDGLISAFVTAGVFTTAQKTDLYAMGQIRANRAQVLWGASTLITLSDISFAIRGAK